MQPQWPPGDLAFPFSEARMMMLMHIATQCRSLRCGDCPTCRWSTMIQSFVAAVRRCLVRMLVWTTSPSCGCALCGAVFPFSQSAVFCSKPTRPLPPPPPGVKLQPQSEHGLMFEGRRPSSVAPCTWLSPGLMVGLATHLCSSVCATPLVTHFQTRLTAAGWTR